MELRTASPRKVVQTRLLNHCAQCGEIIFLPEWSEYLDRHRVRHLWECEACGYKFETLISFAETQGRPIGSPLTRCPQAQRGARQCLAPTKIPVAAGLSLQ